MAYSDSKSTIQFPGGNQINFTFFFPVLFEVFQWLNCQQTKVSSRVVLLAPNICLLLIRCCSKKGYSEYITAHLNETNFRNTCTNKDYHSRLHTVIPVNTDTCITRITVHYNPMITFGKFVIKITDNLFKQLPYEFYFMCKFNMN